MPRVSHFEIHAENPDRAIAFYRDTFQWRFEPWTGGEYWLIMTGGPDEAGIDGGLMKRRGSAPGEAQAVNAYVCTSWCRISTTITRKLTGGGTIVGRGCRCVGWLAYFKDPEGNIFSMMQHGPSAKEGPHPATPQGEGAWCKPQRLGQWAGVREIERSPIPPLAAVAEDEHMRPAEGGELRLDRCRTRTRCRTGTTSLWCRSGRRRASRRRPGCLSHLNKRARPRIVEGHAILDEDQVQPATASCGRRGAARCGKTRYAGPMLSWTMCVSKGPGSARARRAQAVPQLQVRATQ